MVHYDVAALSPVEWGVSCREDQFRFLPMLPVTDCDHAPNLRIGATPLYPAKRLHLPGVANLHWKDETMNPSASMKDRASSVIVMRALEADESVVATASTGNAGSSLACLAAHMGIQAIVFVPAAAPKEKLAQLRMYGAAVVAVEGTYDQAYTMCNELCKRYGWMNRNTGRNPFTREGKKTCSFEIARQMGGEVPDWVVVPTGDGNMISGIWKGFCELNALGLSNRRPKLLCAQAEASAAISNTVEKLKQSKSGRICWPEVNIEPVSSSTCADSIGVDQPRDGLAAVRAVIESGGDAISVSDDRILHAARDLAGKEGFFVEPAAACSWAAAEEYFEREQIEVSSVVCLLTGSGLKDTKHIDAIAPPLIYSEASPDAAITHLNQKGVIR